MKSIRSAILAVLVLLLVIPAASHAAKGRSSGGPQPRRGGHPGWSGSGSGSRPHPGGGFHPGGGSHPGGVPQHGWGGHPGWGARPWWGPRIYWGPAVVWGGGWYLPDYYYADPPVIMQEPSAYVQPQSEAPYYWYYCPNPPGYYPYIQQCPSQWMTVVPPPGPPPQ